MPSTVPGVEDEIELTKDWQEDREIRRCSTRRCEPGVKSRTARRRGEGWRESEASIRAMKPGNAGRAKGRRKEIVDEGNMCLMNAGLEHGNET